MKRIICLFGILLTSCLKQEVEQTLPVVKVKEVASEVFDEHKISLQSKDGKLYVGHNSIYINIKNASTGEDLKVENVKFYPEMLMYDMNNKPAISHSHTCPHQNVMSKSQNTFTSFAIFQMHTGDTGYWKAKISYDLNNQTFTRELDITILPQPNKALGKISRFRHDNKTHFLTLIAPEKPEIGRNEIKLVLYRMNSMTDFEQIKDFKISLDPRMRGDEMKNHSAPHSADLEFKNGYYEGFVNYTMSGNWTLNFVIYDADGQILAGETLPEATQITNTQYDLHSSVYIEVEF